MKMHNLDRIFLIPFREVYLLDYLISFNGTSIPMDSNQTRKQLKLLLMFSVYEYSWIVKFLLKHVISCSLGNKYVFHEYQILVYNWLSVLHFMVGSKFNIDLIIMVLFLLSVSSCMHKNGKNMRSWSTKLRLYCYYYVGIYLLSIFLCLSLSVSLYLSLSLSLSLCLSVSLCLSLCLSVCFSVSLSTFMTPDTWSNSWELPLKVFYSVLTKCQQRKDLLFDLFAFLLVLHQRYD